VETAQKKEKCINLIVKSWWWWHFKLIKHTAIAPYSSICPHLSFSAEDHSHSGTFHKSKVGYHLTSQVRTIRINGQFTYCITSFSYSLESNSLSTLSERVTKQASKL